MNHSTEHIDTEHIVYLVDDDSRIRYGVTDLLESLFFRVKTFPSAEEYLDYGRPAIPSCLLLDIKLPKQSGLELQQSLLGTDHPPIVFITGHGDVPSSVRALRAGAIDFLTKPFTKDDLVDAIRRALDHDRVALRERRYYNEVAGRFSRLTPREREVMELVVAGLLNKQAAAKLGISQVTFQVHRGHIMKKMAAQSFADLVRMSEKLKSGTYSSSIEHAKLR